MLKTDINKNPISKVYDGKKGYTLLELIAVMAILAILASLSVPRFISVLLRATVRFKRFHRPFNWHTN